MSVRPVSVESTWPLRNAVLRPGLPQSSCYFDEDSDPAAIHLAYFLGNQIGGIVSAYPRHWTGQSLVNAWQFRAMAVADKQRRRGIGSALLAGLEQLVLEKGAEVLWCNARESAIAFYLAQGYLCFDSPFSIEGIGPHRRMKKHLNGRLSTEESVR